MSLTTILIIGFVVIFWAVNVASSLADQRHRELLQALHHPVDDDAVCCDLPPPVLTEAEYAALRQEQVLVQELREEELAERIHATRHKSIT